MSLSVKLFPSRAEAFPFLKYFRIELHFGFQCSVS